MRIVVACPSVLQDGANVRNQLGATLCNGMVAVRGYLPPNTKDEPLLSIHGIAGSSRVWLMAQVWDVDKEMLKDLKVATNDRSLGLTYLNEDSMMVLPNTGANPPAVGVRARRQVGAPAEAARTTTLEGYTARHLQETVYVVYRGLSNMEQIVYEAGIPALSTATTVIFPALVHFGVSYQHRSYRAGLAPDAMFNDVMGRIHQSLRGNET